MILHHLVCGEKMKYKKACVYFHQGWTDIMMCLSMINYYSHRYSYVEVLIRSGAKEFVDFYTKNLNNVKVIYLNTDQGRFYGRICKSEVESVKYISDTKNIIDRGHGMVLIPLDYEMKFHGENDAFRDDSFKDMWLYNWVRNVENNTSMHFSEPFYILYGLDFLERINSFCFERDILLENIKFEEFTYNHGNNYILYHDDQENHLRGGLHKSTKIKFEHYIPDTKYVNLNQQSKTFFDYIKILQHSKEIHLVDSVWAAFCYQIDASMRLLEHIDITVYCQRGHNALFSKPVLLNNWKIL